MSDTNLRRMTARKGWTCPQCGRGVAPGITSCDHAGTRFQVPRFPKTIPADCPACRQSGICMCYRPDRDAIVCSVLREARAS